MYLYPWAQLMFIICFPQHHTLYIKANGKDFILVVCIYVDNLIFARNNPTIFVEFKKVITNEFEVKVFKHADLKSYKIDDILKFSRKRFRFEFLSHQ